MHGVYTYMHIISEVTYYDNTCNIYMTGYMEPDFFSLMVAGLATAKAISAEQVIR